MVTINVILATYNGEKYLRVLLDSLFSQTNQSFNLLVRDDNSKDKTIDIIEEYQNAHPNRIKLIQDNLGNLGSSKSFMNLLEYTNSEYIMFCDQDDVWLPKKIEVSLQKIQELENKYTKDIPLSVFTDLQVVDEKLNLIEPSIWKYQKLYPNIAQNWKKLLAQNVITGCTMIINNKSKEFCLPFALDMMIHDQWVGVNISKYGKIDFLEESTLLYRQHSKNVEGAIPFGLNYSKYKLLQIKRILKYQIRASLYFKGVSVFTLIYYKLKINLMRIIRD